MISRRIRQVREVQINSGKKMTQAAFGSKLGVSRDVIKNIEYGRVDPNDLFVQHLCAVFNINEDWLRTGQGEMFKDDKDAIIAELAQKFDMNDLSRDIVSSLLDLPADAQRSIADYIKYIADNYRNRNGKE